ncbi:DUF7837 family putative zinc-binding protein [Haloarcula sebkhae]|uniref:DUF7837 family putative zinc-binding protein n=1 Tax=Haloarcula sebkhae TaxID=932660 RepID=UPI00406BCFB5
MNADFSPLFSVPNDTQHFGHCPNCEERITSPWLLVEYDKTMTQKASGRSVQRVYLS